MLPTKSAAHVNLSVARSSCCSQVSANARDRKCAADSRDGARITVLCFLLFTSLSAGIPDQQRSSVPSEVRLLDSQVSQVATGGFWEENNQAGNFRLIVRSVGREHVSTEVYAQWIMYEESVEKTRTIPIEPLNNSFLIVRSVVFSEDSPAGNGIFQLTMIDQEGKTRPPKTLVLKKPGVYELKEK